MKDNVAAPNLGQANKDYDAQFFWQSYRSIEQWMAQIVVKGDVQVASLSADEFSLSGDATIGGHLTVTGSVTLGAVSAASLALTGNLSAVNITATGTGTFGYLSVENTGTAYLRLKDTGQTGVTVSAGMDIVGSDNAQRMYLGTDGTTNALYLQTTTGPLILTAGSGSPINLGNSTSIAGTLGVTGNAAFGGNITPTVTGTNNLGSATLRWATIYTSDLSLKNEVGDWTIVEGEDDLFITNNRNGKRYKFALVEVSDVD